MAQFRPLGEAKSSEVSIPQPGLVRNVCKQWSVHEDEGLAHRLQHEEFQTHFGHNKEQRRVIRGDIKEARNAYSEELSEAERKHQRHLQSLYELELRDKKIAETLQRKMSEEDRQQGLRRDQDEELAIKLQLVEEEQSRKLNTGRSSSSRITSSSRQQNIITPIPNLDEQQENFQRIQQRIPQPTSSSARVIPVQKVFSSPPSIVPTLAKSQLSSDEHNRRLQQELEDEKLARQIQERELEANACEQDYKLAVESQDSEYARVLEEKEKERLQKLQQKQLVKKNTLELNAARLDDAARNSGNQARYRPGLSQLRNETDQMADIFTEPTLTSRSQSARAATSPRVYVNIATLIDPTYCPEANPPRSQTTNSGPVGRLPPLTQTVSADNSMSFRRHGESSDAPYMPLNQLRQHR